MSIHRVASSRPIRTCRVRPEEAGPFVPAHEARLALAVSGRAEDDVHESSEAFKGRFVVPAQADTVSGSL